LRVLEGGIGEDRQPERRVIIGLERCIIEPG
jgi:hypothetical protein